MVSWWCSAAFYTFYGFLKVKAFSEDWSFGEFESLKGIDGSDSLIIICSSATPY